jgi:hypothetical protein
MALAGVSGTDWPRLRSTSTRWAKKRTRGPTSLDRAQYPRDQGDSRVGSTKTHSGETLSSSPTSRSANWLMSTFALPRMIILCAT